MGNICYDTEAEIKRLAKDEELARSKLALCDRRKAAALRDRKAINRLDKVALARNAEEYQAIKQEAEEAAADLQDTTATLLAIRGATTLKKKATAAKRTAKIVERVGADKSIDRDADAVINARASAGEVVTALRVHTKERTEMNKEEAAAAKSALEQERLTQVEAEEEGVEEPDPVGAEMDAELARETAATVMQMDGPPTTRVGRGAREEEELADVVAETVAATAAAPEPQECSMRVALGL